MANLMHWPTRLNELLEDPFFSGDERTTSLTAPLDIAETDSGYEVAVDLPGLNSESVQVEFKDGRLWVSGERAELQREEGRTYHRLERRHGKFRRVIALPNDVAADRIDASYKDGVLLVVVPKSEAARPRKIDIKVG